MSDSPFVLVAVAAAVVLAAAALLLSSRRQRGPMLTQTRPLPPLKGSLDASMGTRRIGVSLGREIAHLLETGQRPEAVALVRERTGWGAREADETVAKLERLMERLG